MSRATVELDFFGLEKEKSLSSASQTPPHKSLDHRRNFRGIQNTISKINPELLKSVIASSSLPSTPKVDQVNQLPPLPVYVPVGRPSTPETSKETAPLTIFYNGTVTVFNVPHDKAENIMKKAVEASSKSTESESAKVAVASGDQQQLLGVGNLSGDLPLFRRMSLQRFLEKRKARLTSFTPYAGDNYSSRGFGKKATIADTFEI